MIIITLVVVILIGWAYYTGHLAGFKAKVLADAKTLEAGIASRVAAAKPDVPLPAKVATPASIAASLATPAQVTESSIFAAFARGTAKAKAAK